MKKFMMVFFVGVLSISAFAQRPSSVVDREDRRFARAAATGGLAEVALGRMAQSKGADRAVRDFGARMVRDHSRANEELMRIAAQENIPLNSIRKGPEAGDMHRLERLSGPAFDREYKRMMVEDHKKDVAEFEAEARTGHGALREFAQRTLPTLREHLRMAQMMRLTSR